MKVFNIIINGRQHASNEPAGNRVALEVQHDMAMRNPGQRVRVIERVIQSAPPERRPVDRNR